MTNPPIPSPQAQPQPTEDRLLTADQVAEILGGQITAGTVNRSWKKWGLTAHRIGKFLRWRESEVLDFINSSSA